MRMIGEYPIESDANVSGRPELPTNWLFGKFSLMDKTSSSILFPFWTKTNNPASKKIQVSDKEIEEFLIRNGKLNLVKIAFHNRFPTKCHEPKNLSEKRDDVMIPVLDQDFVSSFKGYDATRHCRRWHEIRDLALVISRFAYKAISSSSISSKNTYELILQEVYEAAISCLTSIAVHCANNPSYVPGEATLSNLSKQVDRITQTFNSDLSSKKKAPFAEAVQRELHSLRESITAVQSQNEETAKNEQEAREGRLQELEGLDEQIKVDYGISSTELNFEKVLKVFEEELELQKYEGCPRSADIDIHGLNAVIYKVLLPSSSTVVAVKVPTKPKTQKEENRISKHPLREARVWVRARHENILPLLGFWPDFEHGLHKTDFQRHRLCPTLVSPWCEEGSLWFYLAESEVDVEMRLKIMYEVALGLNHLHCRVPPIIHGNLNRYNVVLYQDRACIMDFSLSKIHEERSGLTTSAHSNNIYLAPELRKEEKRRYTTFADIYSFGCLFFEIISGKIIAETNPPLHIFENGLSSTPLRIPELNNDLHWALAQWCWYICPEARPLSEKLVEIMDSLYQRERDREGDTPISAYY